ncbi:MAG: Rpn family recombination-promoting nuclease/putative transposase [Deltaproteobacteria bacterium]|jgi:predicted transposase/invertase (TIGR01784 family)|nr:Rpn family recombination-promoting nuclease/putative transposase [Deltaproteobacteria bacterium]
MVDFEDLVPNLEWLIDHIFPSPLDDPLFTSIFRDVKCSGLAIKSLLNATLADSGDKPIGEVLTVTPQKVHTGSGWHGYRRSVEATTDTNELILFEVQMRSFKSMLERALSHGVASRGAEIKPGDELAVEVEQLPRVIALFILNFELMPSEPNFHLTHRSSPTVDDQKRKHDLIEIHSLELPKFLEITPDFNNPLHNWMMAFCLHLKYPITLNSLIRRLDI